MSKKAFKSQASSSRAASGAFGFQADFANSLGAQSAFGGFAPSSLSYIHEPPDLTALSDPNIGVAFKNLQKKDSITKARALEDLTHAISSLDKESLEDALLEAWVRLPKW